MQTINIGEFKVTRLGLGTNRLTPPSGAILKEAVSLGINFFDTADVYTGGESEKTIGETLYPYKEVVIATKGGMTSEWGADGSAGHLIEAIEGSLKRLKKETIDLYFLHRVDPNTPFEESIKTLKELQSQGKIKYIGLSEVNVEQIEEARKYIEVSAVENEYNLSERKHEKVLEYCTKERIPFLPWFPLEKGSPQKDEMLEELAEKYSATPVQIALAWLLHKSEIMLPIPGTLSEEHLRENLEALEIELSEDDFQRLDSI